MEIFDTDGAVETLKLLGMARKNGGEKGKTQQEQAQNEQSDRES